MQPSRSRFALRLAGAGALLFFGVAPVPAQPSPDNHTLMRNYAYVCGQIKRGTVDMTIMLCGMLDKDLGLVEEDTIQAQIADVCGNIAKVCSGNMNQAIRERYSMYSQQLSCLAFVGPTNCLAQDSTGRKPRRDAKGDIEVVIKLIDICEKNGAKVPPSLKKAIGIYAEVLDINKDTETAIKRVNSELQRFYSDIELGCRETEEADFVAACTAAIDRQYLARNTQAVLGWSNASPAGGESVMREVLRKALERWGTAQAKSLQKKITR